MPYRSPSFPRTVPRPASAPFAFPSARVRFGVDRFELSFWDPTALLYVLLASPLLVIALGAGFRLPGWWSLTAGALFALGCVGSRHAFYVDRESSWVRYTVCGVRWKTEPTGRHPVIEDNGYDWDEIAVVPSDLALRPPLHDGDRAVLLESMGFWNEAQQADARRLMDLARSEVSRLHG